MTLLMRASYSRRDEQGNKDAFLNKGAKWSCKAQKNKMYHGLNLQTALISLKHLLFGLIFPDKYPHLKLCFFQHDIFSSHNKCTTFLS